MIVGLAREEGMSIIRNKVSLEDLIKLAGDFPAQIVLPEPGYRDLPELFNVDRERRRMAETLLNEKMENALQAFYNAMNQTALRLGMQNSSFATAHGGVFLQDNYSTAHDIALLAGYALKKHEIFNAVCNTKHYSCKSTINPHFSYKWENTNLLLWDSS